MNPIEKHDEFPQPMELVQVWGSKSKDDLVAFMRSTGDSLPIPDLYAMEFGTLLVLVVNLHLENQPC